MKNKSKRKALKKINSVKNSFKELNDLAFVNNGVVNFIEVKHGDKIVDSGHIKIIFSLFDGYDLDCNYVGSRINIKQFEFMLDLYFKQFAEVYKLSYEQVKPFAMLVADNVCTNSDIYKPYMNLMDDRTKKLFIKTVMSIYSSFDNFNEFMNYPVD